MGDITQALNQRSGAPPPPPLVSCYLLLLATTCMYIVQCTYIPVPEKRWPLTKSFSQTHSQLHNALYSVHCTKLSYSLLWVEPGPKLRAIPATAPPKKLKKVIKYLEKNTLTWQTTKKTLGQDRIHPKNDPKPEPEPGANRTRTEFATLYHYYGIRLPGSWGLDW